MAAEVFTRAFLPEALLPGPRSLSTLPPEAPQKPQGIQNKSPKEPQGIHDKEAAQSQKESGKGRPKTSIQGPAPYNYWHFSGSLGFRGLWGYEGPNTSIAGSL